MKVKLLIAILLLAAANVFSQHAARPKDCNQFAGPGMADPFDDAKVSARGKKNNLSKQLNTIIPLNDSVYYWNYDTLASAWESHAYFKDIQFSYDASYNLLGYTWQSWDGITWNTSGRIANVYDANNNLTSQLTETWNGSAWDNSSLYTATFDANNNLTGELYQSWNGSAWDNSDRFSYTYDGNNNMLSQLSETWNGSSWDNSSLFTNTYNINNYLISRLRQSWNGSSWDNSSLNAYTYNVNNKLDTSLDQIWNGSSWDNSLLTTYTYNTDNYLILRVSQYWDGFTWQNNNRALYTRNVNNILTNYLYQSWEVSAWVSVFQFSYTYDVNDFLLSDVYLEYDSAGTTVAYGDSAHFYFHTVVGLQDITPGNVTITISPNPATTELRIENSEFKIESVEIFNTLGEKVYSNAETSGSTAETINVSALSSGIYFLRVKTDVGIRAGKFVKDVE